jgi:hypothetical protein
MNTNGQVALILFAFVMFTTLKGNLINYLRVLGIKD